MLSRVKATYYLSILHVVYSLLQASVLVFTKKSSELQLYGHNYND